MERSSLFCRLELVMAVVTVAVIIFLAQHSGQPHSKESAYVRPLTILDRICPQRLLLYLEWHPGHDPVVLLEEA